MAEPARATGDRLPWLTEVPRSAPPSPAPTRRAQLPLLAFLLGALFALIAIGAYWLGSRPGAGTSDAGTTGERPGMTAQVETSAQAEAQARDEPAAEPDQAANDALESDAEQAAAAIAPTSRVAAPTRDEAASARAASQALRRPAPVRRASVKRRGNGRQANLPAPVVLQPVVRGRIIQTGAFPSRAQAELAWQAMIRKWPYLATKPRLISPLEVRSSDGRATQMFRVQMATASQAQSVVICQRLTAAKQSCVVIY